MPSAPSSSWLAIATTVRAKLGSDIAGRRSAAGPAARPSSMVPRERRRGSAERAVLCERELPGNRSDRPGGQRLAHVFSGVDRRGRPQVGVTESNDRQTDDLTPLISILDADPELGNGLRGRRGTSPGDTRSPRCTPCRRAVRLPVAQRRERRAGRRAAGPRRAHHPRRRAREAVDDRAARPGRRHPPMGRRALLEPLPGSVTWSVLEPARVAVLDRRFAAVAGRWPSMLDTVVAARCAVAPAERAAGDRAGAAGRRPRAGPAVAAGRPLGPRLAAGRARAAVADARDDRQARRRAPAVGDDGAGRADAPRAGRAHRQRLAAARRPAGGAARAALGLS